MKKTLLASSMFLALASGMTYANQPVQAVVSCDTAVADSLQAKSTLDESALTGWVKDRITLCGNAAPEVVTTAIEAQPAAAIAVTLAAIDAAPEAMADIVAAAVAAAPDQAEAIVASVTEAQPTASGPGGSSNASPTPARIPAGGSGGGIGGGTTASSS